MYNIKGFHQWEKNLIMISMLTSSCWFIFDLNRILAFISPILLIFNTLQRYTDTTLHYTTLHYTTLHYTTLHYTTLHYTTLHYLHIYDFFHFSLPSQLSESITVTDPERIMMYNVHFTVNTVQQPIRQQLCGTSHHPRWKGFWHVRI